MNSCRGIDVRIKKLLLCLQEGIPICGRPYQELGRKTGLSEAKVIARLARLRKAGVLRRIDFSLDTRKLGMVSTLVGCRIPEEMIAKAASVIAGHGNISHNYLRRHRLNMWFTLSAGSPENLKSALRALKNDLKAEEFVSLPTEKVYKLKFQLHAV